ncbi:16902_t:CDS:2, partial [Dentiscutata erythropus]
RKTKPTTELDDTNTIKYLPPANCKGLLEKLLLKLLPFATDDERKNTETQLRAELEALEAQFNQNNDNTGKVTIITEEEECDSLSAELWGSFTTPISQAVTEDELTRYLKEQVALK